MTINFSKELFLGSNPGALKRKNKDTINVQTYILGFIDAIANTCMCVLEMINTYVVLYNVSCASVGSVAPLTYSLRWDAMNLKTNVKIYLINYYYI